MRALFHERSLAAVAARRDAAGVDAFFQSPGWRVDQAPRRFGLELVAPSTLAAPAEVARVIKALTTPARGAVLLGAPGEGPSAALATTPTEGDDRLVVFFDGRGQVREAMCAHGWTWALADERACHEYVACHDVRLPFEVRQARLDELAGRGRRGERRWLGPVFEAFPAEVDAAAQALASADLGQWCCEHHLSLPDPFLAGAPAPLLTLAAKARTHPLPDWLRPGELEYELVRELS